jgi:hypothetical protein
MIKKIFIVSCLLTVVNFAQSAGNSGLSFLKFGFGARNIAMADAGTAASNDLTALFYNPAKLTMNESSEIMFMHNEWIQDVRSEILGVKSFLFGIPFALGFNVTNVGNIEIRTKPGDPESTFDANYFFGSVSTAFDLTDEISTGITGKYLYEGLLSDEATGFGIDVGLNYLTPIKNLSASAVIKNLGSMNQLGHEKTKLPSEFRIGGAYDFDLGENIFNLISVFELQKYLVTDDIHFNIAGEVFYNKLLALRAGYQSGYESRGFTAGIGLHWGNLGFDFAFLPFKLGLGNANLFSIQFRF